MNSNVSSTITETRSESNQVSQRRNENYRNPAVVLQTELLVFIFELVCCCDPWGPPDYFSYQYPRVRVERSSLMGTCARWREIVLSTSSLWMQVFINADFESRARAHPHLVLLELERAKTRPLMVEMAMALNETTRTIIDRATVSRFGSLEIICPHGTYGPDDFGDVLSRDVPVPHLHSLSVFIGTFERTNPHGTLDLRQSLHLHTLSLAYDSLFLSDGMNIIPPPRWHNLKCLALRGIFNPAALKAVTECCETLEKLILDAKRTYEKAAEVFSPDLSRPLLFPRLHSLHMCDSWYEVAAQKITAPELSRLRLDYCERLETRHIPAHIHSNAKLLLLEIYVNPMLVPHETDRLALLLITYGSNIKTLAINSPCIPCMAEGLASSLTYMPHLQNLYIECIDHIREEHNQIETARIILERMQSVDDGLKASGWSVVLHWGRRELADDLVEDTEDQMRSIAKASGQSLCFDWFMEEDFWEEDGRSRDFRSQASRIGPFE